MKRITQIILVLALILLGLSPVKTVSQGRVISWETATEYVGQTVTVEGIIVRTYNSGRACFLNFHPDYQKHLSLVIFASDFSRFPVEPERYYLNKKVRVKGRVILYQGRPEIILNSPQQISLVGEPSEPEKQAAAAREISWEEAADYYGQTVWVRGKVVAANNTGKACFLNFHRNWKRYFTVVIFASAFDRFPESPEEFYLNKEIRVYGRVREYQGKPEIIVETSEQIEIIK
jgi:DNA/RNA endonuclease YhcR with UshA esterase domain